jgi:CBS domain-containing protein
MALLFGLIGFFGNPILLFIAFFVWIGAAQEASMTQMRSALSGIPVVRAMLTDFQTLAPTDTLDRAISLIIAGSQQDFPVADDGRVVGVLTRNDLLRGLTERGKDARVGDVMRRDIRIADASEMLEIAFARLHECECRTLPVTRNGKLAGLLTSENVGEFLMIQSALGAQHKTPTRGLRQSHFL